MLSRKSRSLEHILDSGSSSSRSSADTGAAAVATMTLPRLRRCAEVPGMWRAEYGGNTDTMRSCRSINSIKSVQVQSITSHCTVVGSHEQFLCCSSLSALIVLSS